MSSIWKLIRPKAKFLESNLTTVRLIGLHPFYIVILRRSFSFILASLLDPTWSLLEIGIPFWLNSNLSYLLESEVTFFKSLLGSLPPIISRCSKILKRLLSCWRVLEEISLKEVLKTKGIFIRWPRIWLLNLRTNEGLESGTLGPFTSFFLLNSSGS